MPWGFNKKRDAETLLRLARKIDTQPRAPVLQHVRDASEPYLPTIVNPRYPALRAYLIVPKTTITAAAIEPDGQGGYKLVLGTGTACIYRRDQDSSSTLDVQQHTDDNEEAVEAPVYSLLDVPIVPPCEGCGVSSDETFYLALQDMWGDLYVTQSPDVFWRFELAQDLPQWLSHQTGQTVWRWACKRDFDPSANDGDGGYVTNNSVHFKVADLNETGWFGEIGAKGIAEMKNADNGLIGIILDMVCPPECPCGDLDPDYDYYGYCDEYSG